MPVTDAQLTEWVALCDRATPEGHAMTDSGLILVSGV